MNPGIMVLVNVAVAGLVGGVTNHLAIKMLFHPRRPLVWFGFRVPFTPGLIPKRKPEIAVSLGEVVAEYLVTPEGLTELLDKEDFRQSVARKASDWAERQFGGAVTAGDLLRRFAGEEKAAAWLEAMPAAAGGWAGKTFTELWRRGRWGDRHVKDLVPGWHEDAVARWASLAAGWGLAAVKEELVSAEGQAMLRKLAVGLMDRTGGFLGMLAGIFVDEDKLVARLTPFLVQQLESPEVEARVAGLLAKRALEWGDRTLEEALRAFLEGGDPEERIRHEIENGLPWADWTGRLDRFPIGQWLEERRDDWRRWVSRAAGAGLQAASRNARPLIEALGLPDMVRTQVERFPVERLEQVILNVSGREFRAITWLGVLLGGIIGLVQSAMLLIWK